MLGSGPAPQALRPGNTLILRREQPLDELVNAGDAYRWLSVPNSYQGRQDPMGRKPSV